MAVVGLVIPGTGAPKRSKIYYQQLIETVKKSVDTVHFVPIPMLGFGNVADATNIIGRKYLAGSKAKCVIIGHSQGGIIAHLLAMRYPNQVELIVTLASPTRGTTWTDPVNMPVRAAIDTLSKLSQGKIRLRPTFWQFVVPVLPIVRDLAPHSEVNEEITEFLRTQISGYQTHAFIGNHDWAVFPHRSANPVGALVTNYIVAPQKEYDRLRTVVPKEIIQIDAKAGHVTIVLRDEVQAKIESILQTTLCANVRSQ